MEKFDKKQIPSYVVFVIALTLLFLSAANAFSQESNYKREGNNFVKEQVIKSSNDIKTEFTYTVGDNVYPIYITQNGRCYIIRTSKKTGKNYKQYLSKEICLEICAEMHIEYKDLS